MTEQQTWTITEAAKDCRRQNADGQWSSVSRKTIQRALDKDKFPNAYRDDGPKEKDPARGRSRSLTFSPRGLYLVVDGRSPGTTLMPTLT